MNWAHAVMMSMVSCCYSVTLDARHNTTRQVLSRLFLVQVSAETRLPCVCFKLFGLTNLIIWSESPLLDGLRVEL